jgi:hypothetical protein
MPYLKNKESETDKNNDQSSNDELFDESEMITLDDEANK